MMISCTEFIPAYSELFTYLNQKYSEVDVFWDYLFMPNDEGIPLIKHVREKGVAGCFSYWSMTLNEEAADFTMYLNERAGWFLLKMHHCPSKGMLLELKHMAPYPNYCLHCDCYRKIIEKFGLKYIYNFTSTDHAACEILIFDPEIFNGRIVIDKNTEIMDRRASENKYLHKDFHSSLNMGLEYLGSKYGQNAVVEFLEQYTKHYYAPLISEIKERGLCALEENIKRVYKAEEADDAFTTVLKNNKLLVNIKYCPGVKHLHETDRTVSVWYSYSTETVMATIAKQTGYMFQMLSYDQVTGAANYQFESKI